MSQEELTPAIHLLFQSIKDLSVENPTPEVLFAAEEKTLETNLNLDVQARSTEKEDTFEVVISIKATIEKENKTVFLLDLHYSGLFSVKHAQGETLTFILFVQCPHLLFPTVRHLIRQLTQESGLPSINLQPVDFLELLKTKMKADEEEAE